MFARCNKLNFPFYPPLFQHLGVTLRAIVGNSRTESLRWLPLGGFLFATGSIPPTKGVIM